MEEEYIKTGQKQLQRWKVMERVDVSMITLKEAGGIIGVSYRQAIRIRETVKRKEIKAKAGL